MAPRSCHWTWAVLGRDDSFRRRAIPKVEKVPSASNAPVNWGNEMGASGLKQSYWVERHSTQYSSSLSLVLLSTSGFIGYVSEQLFQDSGRSYVLGKHVRRGLAG